MTPIVNNVDRLIYRNEIGPYLPERLFDSHCHLYASRFHGDYATLGPAPDVDLSALQNWWRALFPDKKVNGLVMPYPTAGMDVEGENDFAAQECGELNRFSIVTLPGQSSDELSRVIEKYKPFGLKPYLCFADTADVQQAEITDYLPEEQIALADKYGLAVTLHVSKPRGMADEGNLSLLNRFVKQYPNCKFILAHCGRCFISVNMEDAVKQLAVAENLWLDTSAVCDMGVFMHLFSSYDRSRICFGTDLVNAVGFRGQYVRMGMSWDMVSDKQAARPGGQCLNATYCAYENLRSILTAATFCNFSDDDYYRLFYGNAAKLFNLAY